MFADDLMICCYHENESALEKEVNKQVNNIYNYFTRNKLSINENKCCYMILNMKRSNWKGRIKINDYEIERVKQFIYLGIIIDEQLKFKQIANYTYDQLSTKINIIRRNRSYLNEQITYKVVNAIIYSIINYGIKVYYNVIPQQLKMKPNKLFIETIKLINHTDNLTTIKKKYKILNIDQRYSYFTNIWIWKAIKEIINSSDSQKQYTTQDRITN